MKSVEKFLEFNGKRISVLSNDGNWWIAIKPICDAIDVNYNRAFQNLKEDDFFVGAFAKQQTHDASNRIQEMVCIREKDVYGWLCSLRSESPGLAEYKRKCYDILYNHFHGSATIRLTILNQQDEITDQILKYENELLTSEPYLKIQELKKQKADTRKELTKLDNDLKAGQLSFSFS